MTLPKESLLVEVTAQMVLKGKEIRRGSVEGDHERGGGTTPILPCRVLRFVNSFRWVIALTTRKLDLPAPGPASRQGG